MKSLKNQPVRILFLFVITVLSSVLSSCSTDATTATVTSPVYGLSETAFGKSYQEWSVAWWQWAYNTPAFSVSGVDTTITHPLFDMTGANAANGQNASASVFYIGGSYNSNGITTRAITITSAQGIFFPILNVAMDTVGIGSFTDSWAAGQLDTIFRMNIVSAVASLDGVDIANAKNYLVRSALFNYTLGNHNMYQLSGVNEPAGTSVPAKSDGIWIMLKPLSKGTHVLKFKGVAQFDPARQFIQDMTYNITVK